MLAVSIARQGEAQRLLSVLLTRRKVLLLRPYQRKNRRLLQRAVDILKQILHILEADGEAEQAWAYA